MRRRRPGAWIVSEVISDDRVIELLLRNNASYVPTLWVYPRPEAMRNLAIVSEAGVRIVLGSDSFAPTITVPGVVTGMFGANSIVEAERMVEAGVGPIEVLRSATSRAAVHLERKDIGVVAVGACADLVMFQADPTQSITNWKDSARGRRPGPGGRERRSGRALSHRPRAHPRATGVRELAPRYEAQWPATFTKRDADISSCHQRSAHGDLRAAHVTSGVGGEIQRRFGNLFRAPEAAHRYQLGELAKVVRIVFTQHGRIDEAGRIVLTRIAL